VQQREERATLAPLHDDEEVGGLEGGADEEDDVWMPQLAAKEVLEGEERGSMMCRGGTPGDFDFMREIGKHFGVTAELQIERLLHGNGAATIAALVTARERVKRQWCLKYTGASMVK
jgi:hypothetical protein